MTKYDTLEELRAEFGFRKQIPEKYEFEILSALSHFPEVKNVRIAFELIPTGKIPYRSKPKLSTCLGSLENREYVVKISENAEDPVNEALLKNLDLKMRLGVLAHELGHVIQYHKMDLLKLLRLSTIFVSEISRRKLERDADKLAIEHGLGDELLRYAEYIRLIPEYLNKRPELKNDYLNPQEITYYISHYKLTHVV